MELGEQFTAFYTALDLPRVSFGVGLKYRLAVARTGKSDPADFHSGCRVGDVVEETELVVLSGAIVFQG